MNRRLASNKNLSLYSEPKFKGLSVQTEKGDLIENYLERSYRVMMGALEAYPRTLGIRVDLRIPSRAQHVPDNVISVFFKKLTEIIRRDRSRASREQQYHKPCQIRYIWAKERKRGQRDHYHVVIFLNRDAYHVLGLKQALEGNMAARIKLAWARALNIDIEDAAPGVFFPKNAELRVNKGDKASINDLFYRISYFCKDSTKHYSNRRRCFGYSRY